MATTKDVMLSTGETGSTTENTGFHTVTGPSSASEGSTTADTSSTSSTSASDTSSTSHASSTSSGESSSTGPQSVCGNGVVEAGEGCDDQNDIDNDDCSNACQLPECGDAIVQKGEQCDDGNEENTDECTNECRGAACHDGFVQGDEECDDGNDDDDDGCVDECALAECGDGHVQAGVEVCDDWFNDGAYNGCMPGCDAKGPYCGDGMVQKNNPNKPKGFEFCDGNMPYPGVACHDDCLYDFSAAPQMFCSATCSWAGPSGCDQADADVFCKLKTGWTGSKATEFKTGAPTDSGGFPCANKALGITLNGTDPRIWLGPLIEYGLSPTLDVPYQLTKIKTSHSPYGPNPVILGDSSLKCTTP